MSLDDREYMRKPFDYEPSVPRRPWWKKITLTEILAIFLTICGVVGTITWFVSDVSYLARFLPSREASLIVNINTASANDLETLPGIGPALATLIIADRPYATVDDLDRVQGIGPGKMKSLRPLVVVEGETRKRD